ncbi:hypothetical protein ES703_110914 [subsurface metagenome]
MGDEGHSLVVPGLHGNQDGFSAAVEFQWLQAPRFFYFFLIDGAIYAKGNQTPE